MKELVYPRLLLPVVERLADKVAFVDLTRDGVRYEGTFAVHADRLLRLANAMHSELGLGHGDRFAVLATNGHEFLELYHAALFGVGIINPLNIRFTPAELAYVLHDSGSRIVFTDPLFAKLARWLEMLPGTDFIQGYGMTEAASVLAYLGPEEHRRGGNVATAAGRPVMGVELRITDSLDNALPRGEAGEVCARGGNLMREYWNEPEQTESAMHDGWYHTGDMGFVDSRGLLHLTDRMKDMIVTGGENVYSIEVENAIATHPAVQEVAVIGIPSDVWGEAVHAIVVLKLNTRATAADLIEYVRPVLAGFKVPKSVEFLDGPLPLSGAFKPLKRELRRRYWENRDRQVS